MIPDLATTLECCRRLRSLHITGHQDINLSQLPLLETLTVEYQGPKRMLQRCNHKNIRTLRLSFHNGQFDEFCVFGNWPILVDLNESPNLQGLALFAGGRLRKLPLSFLAGHSTSLRNAQICGPFDLSSVDPSCLGISFFNRLTSVESLSMANVLIRRRAIPLIPASLQSGSCLANLRSLEWYNMPALPLAIMRMPKLEKLFLEDVHLISSVTVSFILAQTSRTLMNLSIATPVVSDLTDYHVLDTSFVNQLLRCTSLRKLQLYGQYYFHDGDWSVLCRRGFPDLTLLCVFQPTLPETVHILPPSILENSTVTSTIVGLENLDKSCLFTRSEFLPGIPTSSKDRDFFYRNMYRGFLMLCDPEEECTIADGNLMQMWRRGKEPNELRMEVPLYSGPKPLADRSLSAERALPASLSQERDDVSK